jgi:hypothetical protein
MQDIPIITMEASHFGRTPRFQVPQHVMLSRRDARSWGD